MVERLIESNQHVLARPAAQKRVRRPHEVMA
jgi:hypothetical protein